MQTLSTSPKVDASSRSAAARLRRFWFGLFVLIMVFPCGGATCSQRKPISEFTPPIVFKQKPTLEELISQLNRVQAIERLSSNSVSLSSPESSIGLSGNLSWHRPMDFRLQAYPGMKLAGKVLDAGSNGYEFWMQTGMGGPATLVHARHDEFEAQPGPRNILPLSPLWIREALGVIEFDPNLPHEGPVERASDGLMEIRSVIPSPRGNYKRYVVVEPTRATVRELWMEDPTGRMVAIASMHDHEYYSAINASLPHRVELQLIPDGVGPDGKPQNLAITIQVHSYTINEKSGDESLRYAMPNWTGMQVIDLVRQNSGLQVTPPAATVPPHTAQQPGFPGMYR